MTLAARLKVAQGTRCRILKVLHGRRYLTQTKRLQLYFLCVRTAAHYGLLPVGITASGLAKLGRFETKHIRAIVRSPVHITREATASLYQRLDLLQPAEYLLKLLTKKLRKLTTSGDAWSWTWVNNRKDQIQQHVHASQHGLQEASHAQPYSCPTCGLYFDTLAGMRTHHTRKHGVKLQRTTAGPAHMLHGLRIQDHCVDNMPVCRHCCCTFSTWHTFRVHVTKSCSVLHGQTQSGPALPSAAGATPKLAMQSAAELIISPKSGNLNVQAPFEMSEVQRLLSSADWKNILQLGRIREILVHHCMLCSQWVASSPGALLRHVRQLHPELVMHIDNAMAHSITLREGHARPCKACGAAPRGKHRCRVLFQLCLMLHYHRMLRLFGLPDGGHDPAGADLRCPEASPGHLLRDGRGCSEDGGGPGHPGQARACLSHQGLSEGTATGGQRERTRSGDGDGGTGACSESCLPVLQPEPSNLDPGSEAAEARRAVEAVGGGQPVVPKSGDEAAAERIGGAQRANAALGTRSPAARRRTLAATHRKRLSDYFRTASDPKRGITIQHAAEAVQNRGDVEDQERVRRGGHPAEAHALPRDALGVREENFCQRGAAGGPRASGAAEIASPETGWGNGVALPEVEHGKGSFGGVPGPEAPGPCRSDEEPQDSAAVHHGSWGTASLSLHQEAGGEPPKPPDLLRQHWHAGSTKPPLLASPLRALFQQQREATSHANSSGSHGTPTFGTSFGRTVPAPGAANGKWPRMEGQTPKPGSDEPRPGQADRPWQKEGGKGSSLGPDDGSSLPSQSAGAMETAEARAS